MTTFPLMTAILLMPLIGMLVLCFLPKEQEKAIKNIKTILATGEKNEDEDDVMEALAKKFAAKELEQMAGEGSRRKPSKDDDLEDGI